jgi:CheY-like chemotaxis protein
MLIPRDFSLYTFGNEDDNLEAVETLRPDLIILGDIRAIEDEDFQFFRRLKTSPSLRKVPIIIATTAPLNLLQTPLLDQQAKVWLLSKPFARQELLDCVNAALPAGKKTSKSVEVKARQAPAFTSMLNAGR